MYCTFNRVYRVCSFLVKKQSNLVSLSWNRDNLYYHNLPTDASKFSGNLTSGNAEQCIAFDNVQIQCISGICQNISEAYQCVFQVSTFFDITTSLYIKCLMVSTNQADPGCFYFRISWILMEGHWFNFFRPLHLMQGLGSLEHWLLHKISMTILDQKFRFRYFCSNISRTWPLKIQL